MGQMRFDGIRTTILDDGTVTVPSEDESGEPLKVGKISRDGQKWVAVMPDRKKQSFPRRKDGLAWLVVRGG
jgi:hypothetical protein